MTNKPLRVVIIGCGGVGSWLAPGIAKAMQYHAQGSAILLVDGDTFEEKNAERQNFRSAGNKAHAVRSDIQHMAPNVFIISRAAWIVSEGMQTPDDEDDNEDVVEKILASQLLAENDIVFCTVDNFKARKLVFDHASTMNNIDVFTGGNGSVETEDALFGSVYHYCRRDGQDITIHPAVMHPEYVDPSEPNPGELSCSERAQIEGGTQLLAVNMGVASYLLSKFSQVVLGSEAERQAALEASEIYFDLGVGLAAPYNRQPQPQPQLAQAAVVN